MPKISVIVPVYNVERFLRRCLDSILDQTFNDWEAVCVNDGSKDSCLSILKEYAEKDSRFVVVDKPNGGLSDARNAAMPYVRGEFIIYVDSDDFIHCQTFELAVAIQRRSSADIVSWYKERNYRNILLVRKLFRLDNENFKPCSMRRRFDAETVPYRVTDEALSVATEYSHPKDIKYPVKHCYVWRHLIKRELLDGISFVKGLSFEDFPWWSEILLKNPRIAYTMLPLYYYYWNPSSIDRSSSRGKKLVNWIRGLDRVWPEYEAKASGSQKSLWSKNFKWAVLKVQILRHLKPDIYESEYADEIITTLHDMDVRGIFDDASCVAHNRIAGRIREFVAAYPKSS